MAWALGKVAEAAKVEGVENPVDFGHIHVSG